MRRVLAWLLLVMCGATAFADEARYDVVVKGSDTVGGELGPALAKGWEALHPGKRVSWQALGSKTAFVGLFDGSADVGASSRPINGDELKQAQQLGVHFQELVIAYDGLAIIVHPQNPIQSLTLQQLSSVYAGKIGNWKEVGGNDEPIELITRPSYSGTRSFFDEKALRRGDPRGAEQLAPNARAIEKNEQIVPFVAEHAGAIAYVGLGALSKKVRVVPLALIPGGAAKLPEAAAIRDGTYPLYRALYLYTRAAPSADAADLVRFALSNSGQDIVSAVGFARLESSGDVRVAAGTPSSEAEPAAPPVRITFHHGGKTLSSEAKKQLAQLVAQLSPSRKLLVVGHADARGAAERIARVSRERADAVATYLRALGVDAGSVEVKGAGAEAPIATNDTRAGREQNRRVDVYLVKR